MAAIKNCAVMWYGGVDHNYCVNLKNGKRVFVSGLMESAYNTLQLRWSVLLVALGVSGTRYQKAVQVKTSGPMLIRQIRPYLEKEHRALIDTMPEKHLHNIGWIARIDCADWDEKEAFELFERFGAFENKIEKAAIK